MIDLQQLIKEVLGLSVIIFALVAQLKAFGLHGKQLTAAAFVVGLLFGGLYRYFVYSPSLPVDWFILAVFGIMGGLVATGAYKGIESATGKAQFEDLPPLFYYDDSQGEVK